jgi:hypothetical protein
MLANFRRLVVVTLNSQLSTLNSQLPTKHATNVSHPTGHQRQIALR